MSGRTTIDAPVATGEPRYRPVLAIETGRVVGAELLRTTAPAPVTVRTFATEVPVLEDWWLALALHHGAAVSSSAVADVEALLCGTGLAPERLVLRVTEAELALGVSSGAAVPIAALGVRFAVAISLAGLDLGAPADVAAVRALRGRAASLGALAIGVDVESDAEVALAGEAGIGLVQGYRWGSPGLAGQARPHVGPPADHRMTQASSESANRSTSGSSFPSRRSASVTCSSTARRLARRAIHARCSTARSSG